MAEGNSKKSRSSKTSKQSRRSSLPVELTALQKILIKGGSDTPVATSGGGKKRKSHGR